MLPEKFLCRFPLQMGAFVFGIIMCIILLASCASSIYQVVVMKDCNECNWFAWRNAYAYSIIVCIFCFLMLAMTIWFLWAVKQEKAHVILAWLVVTALWLLESTCLMIVLVCMYSFDTNYVSSVVAFTFALLAIGIFLYFYVVVFGYWVELRKAKTTVAV